MSDLTFVIPIGPTHKHLAARAIDSAKAQTVPCEILTMLDTDGRGPGALRNAMLAQVNTEFVSYLDSDDFIEPTFAEETIAEYRRIGGDRYIYTDWIDADNRVVVAPCLNGPDGYPLSVPDRKPYCGGSWHVITTLIPTAWARAALFDETLPAIEDTDFYLKLCTTFRCGHHLARPLFHYSPGGGRAEAFHQGADRQRVMNELSLRYGGRMGCCGDNEKIAAPIGQRQAGDVLAMALWQGNRTEYGRATGRMYPRMSMPRTAWVDLQDASMRPDLWRVIEQPRPVDQTEGLRTVAQMAQMGMATVKRSPEMVNVSPPPPIVEARPDVSRVVRLARAGTANLDEPVFVFPEKDYPSYSDFRTLVKLSGFDIVTTRHIDAFNHRPHIVVSPEPIPDLNGLRTRVICWQLEYAGDYTGNYKGFTGEVWASDKAWADDNGAKYVLMGSHPGLGEGYIVQRDGNKYDVTMLGYMTPRRQTIKDQLSDLKWPVDYPGHATPERHRMLMNTRLMLHVHQHEDQRYVAPQRIAIAAAYHMPLISEVAYEIEAPGRAELPILYAGTKKIAESVRDYLANPTDIGNRLYNYLCVERPFRRCVEEVLKS